MMKKRWICLMISALLIAAVSACGVCESLFVDNRETDKIYPERLNLRTEPSKEGGIIGLYYTGAEVENLGQENETYTKVSVGGMTGYMATEYLITAEEAERRYGAESGFGSCRAAQVDLTGMWQTSCALLADTDPQAESYGELPDDTDVRLVAVLDTWAYIKAPVEGKEMMGYVPLDVLTDVGGLKASIVSGSKADTKTMLYAAPGSKAKTIMVLKNGTACFSLFGRRESGWRRVRVGGVSGWIRDNQGVHDLQNEPRSVVPYYPLQMKTKKDVILYSEAGDKALPYMTLGRDMQVEILAEQDDYVYVRTMEGGAGAYDCGDFGFVKISDLTLFETDAGVGVAQVDDGDLPAMLMKQPDAEAELVGALCSGAQVRIVDYTQTDYVQVKLGDVQGYISKDEIRLLTYEGAQASQKIPQRAKVLEDAVLRAKPAASAKGGVTAPAGSRVYMLGCFGEWAFVRYADKADLQVSSSESDATGFVPLEKLSAPASTTHLIAYVNADKVNLRSSGSSESGEIIGRVSTGERARVADYGVEWTLIETDAGKRGYIKTDYLDFPLHARSK